MLFDEPKTYNEQLSKIKETDVYHQSDYNQIEARRLGGQALYYVGMMNKSVLLVPLIERSVDINGKRIRDLTTAYGYPSPICCGEENTISKLVSIFIEKLRVEEYVSLFLRHNPFVDSCAYKFPATEKIGTTVTVCLDVEPSKRRNGYRKNNRRDLRTSENLGIEIKSGYFNNGDIDQFYDLYTNNMIRLGASRAYYFNREYFSEISKSQSLDYRIVSAFLGQSLVSSSLFSLSGEVVQYHLSCSSEHQYRGVASRSIIDAAAEIGRKANKRWLSLGGGLSGQQDSLLKFKQGFSSEARDVLVSKIVLKNDTYESLNTEREPSIENFFPTYRRKSPE